MKRLRRDKFFGWKCPPNARYVGRPSLWGNRFKVGETFHNYDLLVEIGYFKNNTVSYLKRMEIRNRGLFVEDLKNCLSLYRLWLDYVLKKYPDKYKLEELCKYEYLVCFCKIDSPCHADILIEYCEKNKIKNLNF
jgi:hypothetical protein